MFGNILGKNKKEGSGDVNHTRIIEKVASMTVSDMRLFVNNKVEGFPICEEGLAEVIRKLNSTNPQSKENFIQSDAMDSKKKKAFDVVVLVALHIKTTITVVELIQEFMTLYTDMIIQYDTNNKQIYESKIKDAMKTAINNIAMRAELHRKKKVIGS